MTGDTEEPPKKMYAYQVYRKKQSEDVVIFSAFLKQYCYSTVRISNACRSFVHISEVYTVTCAVVNK